MQIRAATLEDSPAIARLLTVLGYLSSTDCVTFKIQQFLAHPDAQVLVAVETDQVLGFVAFNFIPQLGLVGDFCRISYFCVDETAQGRGIGTALEKSVSALAKDRGCDRMEVHCHSRRKLAHQFYYRQGYTESPKYLVKSLVQP
ncbi:MAG TPA: GNAT family N-acetyltransferase [Leptolyngbyaceae cyanobacterium M65_K2018_010]|nr:GNAT family N-acetyltransferase [Leptolyngbyaceae cyanobacterium M65_K2018_010]